MGKPSENSEEQYKVKRIIMRKENGEIIKRAR